MVLFNFVHFLYLILLFIVMECRAIKVLQQKEGYFEAE